MKAISGISFFGLLFMVSLAISERILLIGDSVDRYLVGDWCDYLNSHPSQGRANASVKSWGDSSIKYGGQSGVKQPSLLCDVSPSDSIAFLHIFGSDGNGPYLWVDMRDPFAPTSRRVKAALGYYKAQVGIPHRILFHSLLWDFRPMRSDVIEYDYERVKKDRAISFAKYRAERINAVLNQTLDNLYKNTKERIAEIRKELVTLNDDPSIEIDIGLRTAAWFRDGGELLHAMNDVIRKIAIEDSLTLYDLDHDLWTAGNYDYSSHKTLFRDSHHPTAEVLVKAAKALANERETTFYVKKGDKTKPIVMHKPISSLHLHQDSSN